MIESRLGRILVAALIVTAALALNGCRGGSGPLEPSKLIENFAFADLADATDLEWTILEDRFFDAPPPLAENPNVSRRIVARAQVADATATAATIEALQLAIVESLEQHGGEFKGVEDFQRDTVEPQPSGEVRRSELRLPRGFYQVDETHGVADLWIVAEDRHLTVILTFTE